MVAYQKIEFKPGSAICRTWFCQRSFLCIYLIESNNFVSLVFYFNVSAILSKSSTRRRHWGLGVCLSVTGRGGEEMNLMQKIGGNSRLPLASPEDHRKHPRAGMGADDGTDGRRIDLCVRKRLFDPSGSLDGFFQAVSVSHDYQPP